MWNHPKEPLGNSPSNFEDDYAHLICLLHKISSVLILQLLYKKSLLCEAMLGRCSGDARAMLGRCSGDDLIRTIGTIRSILRAKSDLFECLGCLRSQKYLEPCSKQKIVVFVVTEATH